jgi:hypothetical protein
MRLRIPVDGITPRFALSLRRLVHLEAFAQFFRR